jgi:hypothetical protein
MVELAISVSGGLHLLMYSGDTSGDVFRWKGDDS